MPQDSGSLSDARTVAIGQSISHYRITEKIGEGGMGVVYKAHDMHLDRPVAIKVLPGRKVANLDRRVRFVREAKAASALNHPNIVHVYDIDQQDGIDFIAMEFVAGKGLAELIPRKGMAIKEVLRIALQVADALATAHEAGIIHRDLKPANIIVGDDSRVRLLDFGLAKLIESSPVSDETQTTETALPATEAGTILGTASYMSPEQAEGRAVDARSDIFSFGLVLYEMITGSRAFPASGMSGLAAVIKEDPKPVREIIDDVPTEVERLVRHCLRKDPNRRFQHMADVRSLLEVLKEECDAAQLLPVTPNVPAVKSRLVASVVGVVTVLLLVAAVVYWIKYPRAKVVGAPLIAMPLTSYPGNEMTPAVSPDGKQVAFSWNGETQDNYDIYLKVIGAPGIVRLSNDPAFDWAPAWSPDGHEIRFYRYWREGKFAVMSVPPLPGRERTLRDFPFPPDLPREVLTFAAPAWSPDGNATVHPSEFGLVVRQSNGAVHTLADLPGTSELFPSFAPDGLSLAFVRQSGGANTDLCLLPLTSDLRAKAPAKRLTSGMRFVNKPVWTRDGREIIFSAATATGMGLWRINVSGGSAPRQIMLDGDAWFPSISRDGRRLVYQRRTENSSIWRVHLGRRQGSPEKITSSTRVDALPSYSPDGTKIAFSSYRSGSLEIWMVDADGSRPTQLTFLKQYSILPEWSSDAKQLVFQSSGETGTHLYVVQVEAGEVRRLTQDVGDELQPSWSPDGRWIYFMSDRSGSHQIWRVPSQGGEAKQVTRGGGEFGRVSPDGKELYFTKGNYGSHELWKMATEGGSAETRISTPVVYDWGFVIVGQNLYFATSLQEGEYPIVSLSLASEKSHEVARIPYAPFAKFSISPEERWLAYDHQEQSNSDLMLVDNFQ